MTTLIEQRSDNDCVLASIAMAAGRFSWDELWNEEDLARVINEGGIRHEDEWLERAGLGKKGEGWMLVYVHGRALQEINCMLWHRRALLSVHSLNIDHGHHMIYWDGEQVFDPSTKTKFKFLYSAVISEVILFKS